MHAPCCVLCAFDCRALLDYAWLHEQYCDFYRHEVPCWLLPLYAFWLADVSHLAPLRASILLSQPFHVFHLYRSLLSAAYDNILPNPYACPNLQKASDAAANSPDMKAFLERATPILKEISEALGQVYDRSTFGNLFVRTYRSSVIVPRQRLHVEHGRGAVFARGRGTAAGCCDPARIACVPFLRSAPFAVLSL